MILKKSTTHCQMCPFFFEDGMCHEYVPGIALKCKQPSDARLLIMGEAPALDEKICCRPLSPNGQAGRILDNGMREAGLDEVPRYIANVVMCTNLKPAPSYGRKWKTQNPSKEVWKACAPKWHALVQEVNPAVILLLGKIPMHAFGLGDTENRTDTMASVTAGNPFHDTGWAPNVVLTYHPSGLRDISARKMHFKNSLQLVRSLLSCPSND
jgi:DNA polymerase